MHLFAHRLEALYADFAQRAGVDAAWLEQRDAGPHLGRDGKFVVLLFEQESHLGRYLRRFCDCRADRPVFYRVLKE